MNDIQLQSNASITVSSGGSLTLNGALSNSGAVTIQNGGGFLQGSGSSITGSGTFSVQRQGSTGQAFNFWSSPITSQNGIPGNSFTYNSASSTQDDSDDQPSDPGWSAYNGPMEPGIGYAGQGGGLSSFSGTPNNGNINVPLYYSAFDNTYSQTTPGTPFNLVGNPYPSAISAASLVGANSDIDGTLYFWNDDNSGGTGYHRTDFAYWNGTGGLGSTGVGLAPDGFIGTAQGFYVLALNGSAVLNFTNAQRVTGNNTQFHKESAETGRLWFSIDNEQVFDEILIGLLDDATDYEDRLYDAVKMKSNQDVSLSAVHGQTEYAIMAFPPPTQSKMVPLQIKISEYGTYQFRANTIENLDAHEVYLVDLDANSSVLLSEGQAVSVDLSGGVYANRFYLNFIPIEFTGVTNETSDWMTTNVLDDQLHITLIDASSEKVQFEVLDMNGRLILTDAFLGQTVVNLKGLSRGVYILRVAAFNRIASKKIVRP